MTNTTVSTITKLANLSQILKAATLLHSLGLSNETGPDVVKRYVLANPDINELLQRIGA